jgi:hypothetical protein
MYTTLTLDVAKAKQHDLLVQAEQHNLARQARKSAPASQPSATRKSQRAWRLALPLRPQAQS